MNGWSHRSDLREAKEKGGRNGRPRFIYADPRAYAFVPGRHPANLYRTPFSDSLFDRRIGDVSVIVSIAPRVIAAELVRAIA